MKPSSVITSGDMISPYHTLSSTWNPKISSLTPWTTAFLRTLFVLKDRQFGEFEEWFPYLTDGLVFIVLREGSINEHLRRNPFQQQFFVFEKVLRPSSESDSFSYCWKVALH
jgi:hypothetical protein